MSKFWGVVTKQSTLIKSLFVTVGALGALDYVSFTYWEKERKRLSRMTDSFQTKYGVNAQSEYLKSNCGLLITPSLSNIHAFDQFKNMDDDDITEINFKNLLDNNVDWESDTLSFKNIPENVMSLVGNYWDCMRKEPFIIKDKYYIYKLLPRDHIANIDIANVNIVFDDLTLDHVDDVLKLNGKRDALYMKQVIESDRVAIGAFDSDDNDKLIGLSYVNLDDLTASKVVMHPSYKDNGDIVLRLSQLTVNQHFKQNYDHLNTAIDIDDTDAMGLCESIGFTRFPQTYYWIESMKRHK